MYEYKKKKDNLFMPIWETNFLEKSYPIHFKLNNMIVSTSARSCSDSRLYSSRDIIDACLDCNSLMFVFVSCRLNKIFQTLYHDHLNWVLSVHTSFDDIDSLQCYTQQNPKKNGMVYFHVLNASYLSILLFLFTIYWWPNVFFLMVNFALI